ncbi:hypothetical protein Scep_022473 [Stephania cephalantha]|uniref:Uncharacterized protein n=1 Tax=Stephania cephalantha TaxID=152367 RepID=A0AAP0I2Q3_9MAGN
MDWGENGSNYDTIHIQPKKCSPMGSWIYKYSSYVAWNQSGWCLLQCLLLDIVIDRHVGIINSFKVFIFFKLLLIL